MSEIFLNLLNLSITASWLVLAVVTVRFIFKKAPKWVFCALWALVGIRLVFPFSIESIFSLIPSTETVPPTIVYDAEPQISTGIYAVNSVVNPIVSQTFAPEPASSVNPMQIAVSVASAIWIIGVAVMIIYALVSYFSLRNKMKTATLYEDNIFQSEAVESPFVLGFFKPKIYLPYSIAEADISHVVAHEKAHIKRKDHFIKPLSFLILSVYWFNPVMWVAYVLLCRDIELACDEKVIKELGENERKEYSYALLNCSVNRRIIAACPLAFGEVGVKDRIKSVMNYKKPAFWIIVAAVVASVVVAVCFMTNPSGDLLVNVESLNFPSVGNASVSTPYGILETSNSEEVAAIKDFAKSVRVSKTPVSQNRSESRESAYRVSFTATGPDIHEYRFYTLNFNSDCSEAWVDNFVKPTLSYKVKNSDDVLAFFESWDIYCKTYVAGEVVYSDGGFSMVGGVTGNYYYDFDSNMLLKEKTSGVLGWTHIGQMGEYVLDEQNFDNTFSTSLEYGDFSAEKLRKGNKRAWKLTVDKDGEIDGMYMLLEQKNGDLYFLKGRGEYGTRWVYKLVETTDTAPKTIESAVSEAILANNNSVYFDTWRGFESHYILDQKTEQTDSGEKVYVYSLTLYEVYYLSDEGLIVRDSASAVPVMMTFLKNSEGSYILSEYAEHDPKADPKKSAEIEAMFTEAVSGDHSDEIEFMQENCYEKASAFFNIGDYSVRYDIRELMPYVPYSSDVMNELHFAALNRDTFMLSSVQHEPIYKFDTLEELRAFRDRFADKIDFDAGYDECPSFNEYISKFNEEYFRLNSLLLVFVTESSGSFRHQVGGIVVKDGSLLVTVNTVTVEEFTNDMASWFVPVQISKNVTDACTSFDAIKGADVEKSVVGKYSYSESTDPIKPYIVLYNNGQYDFMYSVLSSYWPRGGYEIQGEYLVLTTTEEDNPRTYTFKINGADLIFDAEKSYPMPNYNKIGIPVPDGAVFE